MSAEMAKIVGLETGKDETYYSHVRYDINPLLPANATQIMDVGCGEGLTAAWLKQRYKGAKVIGVEGNAELRDGLRRKLDEVHIIDLNKGLPDVRGNDLILFLDVLEHLPDPLQVLKQARELLADGGKVIVSVPNIANLWVSGRLFWKGEFKYGNSGILDRTHMRFFVRKSLEEMMTAAGFVVVSGMYSGMFSRRQRLLNFMTFGMMANRIARQLIAVGMKIPTPQGSTKWIICEKSQQGTKTGH